MQHSDFVLLRVVETCLRGLGWKEHRDTRYSVCAEFSPSKDWGHDGGGWHPTLSPGVWHPGLCVKRVQHGAEGWGRRGACSHSIAGAEGQGLTVHQATFKLPMMSMYKNIYLSSRLFIPFFLTFLWIFKHFLQYSISVPPISYISTKMLSYETKKWLFLLIKLPVQLICF